MLADLSQSKNTSYLCSFISVIAQIHGYAFWASGLAFNRIALRGRRSVGKRSLSGIFGGCWLGHSVLGAIAFAEHSEVCRSINPRIALANGQTRKLIYLVETRQISAVAAQGSWRFVSRCLAKHLWRHTAQAANSCGLTRVP
jgi:hypothetical protein